MNAHKVNETHIFHGQFENLSTTNLPSFCFLTFLGDHHYFHEFLRNKTKFAINHEGAMNGGGGGK